MGPEDAKGGPARPPTASLPRPNQCEAEAPLAQGQAQAASCSCASGAECCGRHDHGAAGGCPGLEALAGELEAAGPAPGQTVQPFATLEPVVAAALRASIKSHGVILPVVVDQHGTILDGHQRTRIAAELGAEYKTITVVCETDEERLELARTLNADRRQLSPEQRQAVAASLREQGHSVRAIAGALQVPKSTVADDLRQLSGTGQLKQPDQVKGLDGKRRKATRPKREAAARATTTAPTLKPWLLPPSERPREVLPAAGMEDDQADDTDLPDLSDRVPEQGQDAQVVQQDQTTPTATTTVGRPGGVLGVSTIKQMTRDLSEFFCSFPADRAMRRGIPPCAEAEQLYKALKSAEDGLAVLRAGFGPGGAS